MMTIRKITAKLFKTLLLPTLAAVHCACGHLLDEKVDNRTLISTLADMQATVSGLNPRADYLFAEYMTGNYVFKNLPSHVVVSVKDLIMPVYTFRATQAHLSNADYPVTEFNPNKSWQRYYYRIQNAWEVIDRATKYHATQPSEEKRRNAILGNALATKAYCNFMLVNLFAPPYDSITSSNDPGIPLVKAYTGNAIERYPTVSVKKAYDAVEQDLLTALPLMDDDLWANTKFNFTKPAVYALLSRFYLFKQDWKKAILYADSVIVNNNKLLNTKTLYNTYSRKVKEYSKQFFDPKNDSYLLMSSNTTQYLSYYWSGFYPYPIENFLQNKGGRPAHSTFIQTSSLFSDRVPIKVRYFLDSPGKRHQGVFPLLSVDETHYNRAEAYVHMGDITKAKADLQRLLSYDNYPNQTWTGRLASIAHKDTLMNYLLDSKRMRFFGEGMRWFDIRRHRLPVTHRALGETYTIDGNDPKAYAVKFPTEEIDFQK